MMRIDPFDLFPGAYTYIMRRGARVLSVVCVPGAPHEILRTPYAGADDQMWASAGPRVYTLSDADADAPSVQHRLVAVGKDALYPDELVNGRHVGTFVLPPGLPVFVFDMGETDT